MVDRKTYNHSHSSLRGNTVGQLLCRCECFSNDEKLTWSGLRVLVFAVDMEVEVPLASDLGMLLVDVDPNAGQQFVDLGNKDIY